MDQDFSSVENLIKNIIHVFNLYSDRYPIEMTQEQLKEFIVKELPNFVKKSEFSQDLLKQLDNKEKEEKYNLEELFALLARMAQTS
ncbi:protein S100-A9-like [Peromyscus californicus insignis]|uniref:protein S100-A9-like n=1 Tax=Peromyscus californicus insignis TaxID=564181 RepID=UPI0022A7D8D2|nr:protein S100-A9-like [Peromyscus californicus insignis]